MLFETICITLLLEDISCPVATEQVSGVVGGNELARVEVSVEKGEATLGSYLAHQFGIKSVQRVVDEVDIDSAVC